jgi:hypothetical protein
MPQPSRTHSGTARSKPTLQSPRRIARGSRTHNDLHAPDQSPIRLAPADPIGATLADILKQVNDWLKFAEGKNAGIVALASAGALSVTGALAARTDESWEIRAGIAVSGVIVAFSLLLGLASFMPRTDQAKLFIRRAVPPSLDDNLLFYGHLARYAPKDLAEAVAHRYCQNHDKHIEQLHVDLAAQITINSRITLEKLRFFSYAVALFALAAALLTAAVILSAFT